MNKHLKSFLHRGMLFGGFGPLVTGLIYWILSCTIENITLSGGAVFIAILSTYLLAFVHAGTSVFHQIEHWPIAKAMLFQLGALYLAYTACYLINAWIPFDLGFLAVYTGIFIAAYLIICLTVYLITRATGKALNGKLRG